MQTITTIGLDIAKSVFQVHGVDAAGEVVIRRQLKRRARMPFRHRLRRLPRLRHRRRISRLAKICRTVSATRQSTRRRRFASGMKVRWYFWSSWLSTVRRKTSRSTSRAVSANWTRQRRMRPGTGDSTRASEAVRPSKAMHVSPLRST